MLRKTPSLKTSRRNGVVITAGVLLATVFATAACSTTAPGKPVALKSGVVQVVAAENFWGSLATQLGGEHASVHAIITNPDADPHDYEPTAADAGSVAAAQLAIVNGVGYDAWATKLAAANPSSTRVVLTVGDLVGVAAGGNPHRWYDPDNVRTVMAQITADYKKLDPADAAYFDAQNATVLNTNLKQYFDLINQIKTTYSGTPVGASESIFAPLATATGLNLLTPESFLDAISEGGEPTAADKVTIDKQIKDKQIKVYVYNRQNATPDVAAQVAAAKAAGIPVTTITETLTPAGATFQDWQDTQLTALIAALNSVTTTTG
jgi:zinc/manganese transport system substrate-binding protein